MSNSGTGILLLLVGPTASGKTTLLNKLLARRPDIRRMVTATTRAPRPGEIDGENYYFLDRATFEARIKENWFLEYEDVHGNLYGTPRDEIRSKLATYPIVAKDVDVRGALSLKHEYNGAVVAVFVLPPSMEVLVSRLTARGTEDDAAIKRRLERCKFEIGQMSEFDYWITNDVLETALVRIEAIITAEKQRMSRRLETEAWIM
ncbi:MAG: guanylate kinase [Planctomycetota bacterium]